MIPSGFKIDEYIKSERFYIKDFRAGRGQTKLKLYDHFLNDWMEFDRRYANCFELIKGEALSKKTSFTATGKKALSHLRLNWQPCCRS